MAVWHSVRQFQDGDDVCADTLNGPITALAARTEYLRNLIENTKPGNPDSVSIREVELSDTDTPVVGDIVCLDKETGRYGKAIASMSLYDAYTASEKAYAVGILINVSDTLGTVVLYGRVSLRDFDMSAIVEDGVFVTGQYYLSSTTPGKITLYPNGPRISVGFFSRLQLANGANSGDFALINPQHMDIESHAHRTYSLLARPAGKAVAGETVSIAGYPPESGADIGIPGLAVCGDWTSEAVDNYRVTITNEAWPCSVSWVSVTDSTVSGSGELRFFGDSIAVGPYGLRVKLVKTEGMSEDAPFDPVLAEEPEYVWTVGRNSGRGWASAELTAITTLGGAVIRIGGYASRFNDTLKVSVPESIFYLDESLDVSDLAGVVVSVDGIDYTFTNDPDDTEENHFQVQGTTFDTFAQLVSVNEHIACSTALRQVLIGGTSATITVDDITSSIPVAAQNGSAETKFAIVSDINGNSVAPALAIPGVESDISVCALKPYSETVLTNGLTVMAVSNPTTGSSVSIGIDGVPDARFRYAIEFDNNLKLHFPPVPARSGALMLNGIEVMSYENYGDKAVVAIGDDSIYWRDDNPGRQPWPIDDMAQGDTVPPEDDYTELFHFVSEFHSETGPVTSLRPAEGSPVKVRRCGTDEDATVGDLEIDVDLMMDMSNQDLPGFRVPKAGRGGRLLLGPVVEKLVAGPGISLSKLKGMPEGQGTVVVSADGAAYAGDFETLALENAKQESIGMFPFVKLLKWDPNSDSNIPTAFVAKFHVPATAYDAVYRVRFYASVFGDTSFENDSGSLRYAGVQMDYSILPDFTGVGSDVEVANLKTGLIGPNSPVTLDIPFGSPNGSGGTSYSAYDPVLIHNDTSIDDVAGRSARVVGYAIPTEEDCSDYLEQHPVTGTFGIRPGYTVAIRFSRTSPSAGLEAYTGAIGFLNLRWSLEEVKEVQVEPANTESEEERRIINETVRRLKAAAAASGNMRTTYDIVGILTKILTALK